VGIPAIIWEWRDAVFARGESAEKALAESKARERADQALALVQIKLAEQFFAATDDSTGLAYLASALRQTPTSEAVAAQAFSNLNQRVFALPLTAPLRHRDAIYFAQFSPDGLHAVTASADGTAQIWDVSSGLPSTPPLRHAAAVWFAQFSPDGRRVATASEDTTARVWNAETGEPLTPPLEHEGSVGYLYFSPDGRSLVTGTWEPDWSMRVWDTDSGLPLFPPIPNVHRLRCPPFSPDGQQ
jgi:WD40 repeat protein